MEQQLYDLLRQCTVRVSIAEKVGHGTGFFVAPGLIVTCAHVIKTVQPAATSIEVYWNGKLHPARIIKTLPDPDLALLQVSMTEHPCVSLHDEASPFDMLYSFGYPDDHPDGDPATFSLEGKGGEQEEQLKFKTGQIRPGFSGAPLLNVRTGQVCGVVQLTRDRNTDLGGRAIPTATMFRAFPELVSQQRQYHLHDRRWKNNLEFAQVEDDRGRHLVTGPFDVSPTFVEHRQPARHDCYAQISFPANYVVRMDVLSHVRDTMLADEPTVALTSGVQYDKPQVLHGMGGIGKSVIACALCDDISVQAAFPDGILWATLGQTPQLISTMRLWINALGGIISENAPTVDSLKITLAELLKDRACLLILDDVWRRSHADAFRVGGSRCRMLLTTRDAEIARELGARVLPIPVMTEAEATTLLEEWADGCLVGTDSKLEGQIVKRLGYLPLAVKLAGTQLRRKPAGEWLRKFDVRKLKSSRPEDIHDNLELTFSLSLDALDKDIRRLYIALAIFREDEATPQRAIERLWKGLGDLDAESATDLLDDLAARALLEVTLHQSSRAIRLHDLLRDLIKAELKEGSIAAHQLLLRSYCATCKGAGWHTAQDDGYLYNHLVYHLRAAGAVAELKGLFVDQNWLQARVLQYDYTYDGYLEDLSQVWECAKDEARQQIVANKEPTSFAECMRYALIRTSINSIAENYVPELIARAVEVDLWTPHRALSVAAKVPDAEKRARMYISILGTGRLSRELREEAQRLGLEAALIVPDEEERVERLAALASQLTGKLLEKALQQAQEATLILEYEDEQAKALAALAPYLKGELLKQALEIALALEYEDEQARVLVALIPHLRGELLERALEATLALEDEKEGGKVLTALAPHLRGELLERALEATLALEDEEVREQVLSALEPHLPGKLLWQVHKAMLAELLPQLSDELRETLKTALGSKNEEKRAEVLAALEPHLRDELRTKALERGLEAALELEYEEEREETLEQALGADLALEYAEERAQVLAALGADMTLEYEVERVELLELALETDPVLEPEWEQSELLEPEPGGVLTSVEERVGVSGQALAPELTEEKRLQVLERVLNKALALDLWERAWVLVALAPELTGRLHIIALERAFEIALTLEFDWEQAKALVAMTPHLAGQQRIKVLECALGAALSRKYTWERMEALTVLAPYLTNSLMERAIELTLKKERVEALTVLAPYLPSSYVMKIFDAVLALKQEGKRADAVVALASHLTGDLLEQGLEVALVLKHEKERADALLALLPHLTGKYRMRALERALEAALTLLDKDEREEILVALAPQLTDRQLESTLKAALALEYKWERVKALLVLAPYLTSELLFQTLAQVLKACQVLKNEEMRVEALATLASQLMGELRTQVLELGMEIALTLEKKWERVKALAILMPQLTGELRTQALERRVQIALSLEHSWEQAEALTSLAPYLMGKLQAEILVAALKLVDYHHPEALGALAPYLTKRQLEQTLEAISTLRHERTRTEALALLAPHLTDKLLEKALEATLTLEFESERAEALHVLAPHLTGRLIERGLEGALALNQGRRRAKVLIALAPHLTGRFLEQAFEAALVLENKEERAKVLIALAPHLTGRFLEQAFEAALRLREQEQAEALVELAPYLSSEMLEQAFEATLRLWRWWRTQAWAALVPYLRGKLLEQVLEATLTLDHGSERVEALQVLAPHLTGRLIERGLEGALALKQEWEQAEALAVLVPYLRGKMLEQAFEVALAMEDQGERARVLVGLVSQLKGKMLLEMLERALESALAIEDEEERVIVMGEFLSLGLDRGSPSKSLRQAMISVLLFTGDWFRWDVFQFLQFFIEKLFTRPAFSSETLNEIASSVVEICEKWRWL